jgi:photosystem II stability/assembly factor-like uncharacterized protein
MIYIFQLKNFFVFKYFKIMNLTGLMFLSMILQLFPVNVFSQDNWIRQTSPVSTVLFNCVFTDSSNGWAAGDSGVIIHTSDGGNNWVKQITPVTYYINDIFFINKRLGWAIANEFLLDGTTILKTTNGGTNWTYENFQDSVNIFRTVYFLDSLTGFIGGFGGAVFKTTDAGNSWNNTKNDSSVYSSFPIAKFVFTTNEIGFACGGQIDIVGVIWKTTNGGEFWTSEGLSPEPFYDIAVNNNTNVFAVGGDFEYGAQYSKSTNTGLNWNYENLGFFGQGQSIDFRTQNEAWMPLGFSGAWAVSYDSGNVWSTFPTTDNVVIYSVAFPDSLHGIAVGSGGVILKYAPATVGINYLNSEIPESFILHQNYPNPFNPATKINYELRVTNYVLLKVFDILGNEISTIVIEKQNPGNYSYDFNGENFPSGVYFYKLTVGDYTAVKRMVLLK